MFGYFSGVKLCDFHVLHSPSSSQHYDRPHYSFRCNIESKHFGSTVSTLASRRHIFLFNHETACFIVYLADNEIMHFSMSNGTYVAILCILIRRKNLITIDS